MNNYTTEQVNEMIASGKKLVIDFKANWCGPCKTFLPIFEEVSKNEKFSDTTFVACDVDENSELPMKFGVRNIPSIILIENGEVKKKNVGAMLKFQFEEFLS
jgi:thioredoxin 1